MVVTADDIPGENVVSLIDDDQPVLVPVGGEIRHQAEPVRPDRGARSRDRCARRAAMSASAPSACAPVFDPLDSEHEFAHYTVERGDAAAAMAQAHLVIEGTYRVGHQEQLYIENQAMIAVPREDGGVTVHGSLQCPYYIHKAMKRALEMGDELAVVVQAETGGGFGGKEEYPSMIALHAALLALKCRKPVRMIYDRHEDISATTKRHPAVVRYRSGVTGDRRAGRPGDRGDHGRRRLLHPDAGRAVARHAARRRAVSLRERADHRARDGHQHAAQRRLPRLRRPADRVRGRDAGQPHRRGAGRSRRSTCGDAGSTARATRRPPARCCARAWAAMEVLEAAAEASAFDRPHRQTHARGPREADRRRASASGIGLALAWHGAGFTGSRRGQARIGRVSVELTDDGRIRILTASTEMGQGTKTIFPQLVADTLGVEYDEVEIAPQDTSIVPDSGPTVASRTAMVVGGLLIRAAERLRAQVEEETGRPLCRRRTARPARCAWTSSSRPIPGVTFDDKTYTGDAYPAFGWAARRGRGRGRPRHGRGDGARLRQPPTTSDASSIRCWPRARSRAARCRRSATPPSRR